MRKGSVLFEVIVGTYEQFVLGFQYVAEDENVGKGELSQTFATHSHRASVRSIACKRQLVVSGGADETINIYNMFTRKECGMLMEHNGTVTSLSFTPDCSHVISTSEDGSIKVFRQGSWQLEKVWPSAHKGTAVTCLVVHPSGKMALSVGKDHTLRTWNLVKGRPAYTTNLYSRCRQLESVVWSTGGQLFAIPMDSRLEISSTEKAGVLHSLQLPTRITSVTFLSDDVVCVGEESGCVSGFSVSSSSPDCLWSLPGTERVRGLASLHCHLIVATSSGTISVYFTPNITSQPAFVVSTQTGCRITCLTLYDFKSEVKVKQEPSEEKNSEDTKSEKSSTSSSVKRKTRHPLGSEETSKSTTPMTSHKKQKVLKENSKSREVVCSPRNQKWLVEDSKR